MGDASRSAPTGCAYPGQGHVTLVGSGEAWAGHGDGPGG